MSSFLLFRMELTSGSPGKTPSGRKAMELPAAGIDSRGAASPAWGAGKGFKALLEEKHLTRSDGKRCPLNAPKANRAAPVEVSDPFLSPPLGTEMLQCTFAPCLEEQPSKGHWRGSSSGAQPPKAAVSSLSPFPDRFSRLFQAVPARGSVCHGPRARQQPPPER